MTYRGRERESHAHRNQRTRVTRQGWQGRLRVDTRTRIDGGKRSFFAHPPAGRRPVAVELAFELAPNLGESWDWTFQQLRDHFVAHVGAHEDGDVTGRA